jgi:hypothetical protein
VTPSSPESTVWLGSHVDNIGRMEGGTLIFELKDSYGDGRPRVWRGLRPRCEEDCTEVGFRSSAGIWLEARLDVDDEGRADRGEQTGLRVWSTLSSGKRNAGGCTKIKVVLRSSLYFLGCCQE